MNVKQDMFEEYTKYEKARIVGARALQISMNAPMLIKLSGNQLEELKYDSLKIAEIEFQKGVLPITVKRPYPTVKEEEGEEEASGEEAGREEGEVAEGGEEAADEAEPGEVEGKEKAEPEPEVKVKGIGEK